MTSLPPPISPRDADVARFVARFRQLTSRHVAVLAFPDVTQTPVDRSLRRLLRHRFLTRIPRVSGDGKGSHGWIYQLARKGWSFAEKPDSYKKLYKPDWHALMVADITCDFLAASKNGRFTLQHYDLEVERRPADVPIRPDLVVQLETHGEPAVVLVEAETGSHGLKRLNGKCEATGRLQEPMSEHFRWCSSPYLMTSTYGGPGTR